MAIKNLTKNTVISKEYKIATSFFDQLLGLLNPKNPRTLVFHTRFGIHTFLLKEPIDIAILDKKNYIKQVKKNLLPNRLFFWNPIYSTVIELPKNSLSRSKTTLKDKITFF